MKKLKKALRLLWLVVFILLAASGMGFGFILSGNREKYGDREIKTEQAGKKEDDDEHELKVEKKA